MQLSLHSCGHHLDFFDLQTNQLFPSISIGKPTASEQGASVLTQPEDPQMSWMTVPIIPQAGFCSNRWQLVPLLGSLEDAISRPHLPPRQAHPGLFAIGKHLPEGDSEHPDIRGTGEDAQAQTLRGTPGEEARESRSVGWASSSGGFVGPSALRPSLAGEAKVKTSKVLRSSAGKHQARFTKPAEQNAIRLESPADSSHWAALWDKSHQTWVAGGKKKRRTSSHHPWYNRSG